MFVFVVTGDLSTGAMSCKYYPKHPLLSLLLQIYTNIQLKFSYTWSYVKDHLNLIKK